MTDSDWDVGYAKSLGVFLNGLAIPDPDVHGRPILDDSFYLILNAWDQEIDFTVPGSRWASAWGVVLDTSCETAGELGSNRAMWSAGSVLAMSGRQLLLLQSITTGE